MGLNIKQAIHAILDILPNMRKIISHKNKT